VGILEIDLSTSVGAATDVHDASSRRRGQEIQQMARQREVPEMIHAELQLESVFGERLGWDHHPRIVDEYIQTRFLPDDLRRGLDGLEARQVEGYPDQIRVRVLPADPLQCPSPLLLGATSHQDAGTPPGEDTRGFESNAGIGSGHEEGLSLLPRDA
jgi:hypothetical protein